MYIYLYRYLIFTLYLFTIMGLFITFIFMLSGLAYASSVAAVPAIEDTSISEEMPSSEIINVEDNSEPLA